ncbi:MAG: hypothetical protein VW546_10410 [Gammaproteobacteria bacterium]
MHTTIRLTFAYPNKPELSETIDPVRFDQPAVLLNEERDEWTATYYVVVTSPEHEVNEHIDWIIANHGRKDWEELLIESGRVASDKSDPNYNFDVYYDRVHSEVVSQSPSSERDLEKNLQLDS